MKRLSFLAVIVWLFLPAAALAHSQCDESTDSPFSMADTGVVTKQLEIAGYKDIKFEQGRCSGFRGQRPG
jgi:hypothetical protein